MKRDFYWRTEDLVVVGLFAALSKAVSLAIALVGGGMNPFTLFLKNGVATALLVVLVARVGRFGVLTLQVLVTGMVSLLMFGGMATLFIPNLIAAFLCDCVIALLGGYRSIIAVLLGVAAFDFLGRAMSLGYSFLMSRENMGLVMMAAATVTLGYLGCLLVGLPFGAKFVKELRHAGIIREV